MAVGVGVAMGLVVGIAVGVASRRDTCRCRVLSGYHLPLRTGLSSRSLNLPQQGLQRRSKTYHLRSRS